MTRASLRVAVMATVLFLFFLLLTLPARHVWGWLGDGQLAVQDIEGTLWQGRVARLVHPAFSTGPLAWQLRPQALLRGRIEYQLFMQSGAGGGELRAGRGLLTGVYVADAHLTLPAAELAQRLHLQLVSVAGDFQIDLDELRLSDAGIGALQGIMVWRGAQFIQPSALTLGHLQMQLGLREGQVVGTLSDQGGPLELTGELLIEADKRYRLDAYLKPRADADASLREALGMLGAPDAQKRYRLQYSGSL
jgi:hypothetical protein